MSDDHSTPGKSVPADAAPSATQDSTPAEAPAQTPSPAPQPVALVEDRASLLTRARQFLLSPQVHDENENSKRRFLQEKGLSEDEIGLLLREQVRIAPFSYVSDVKSS
jgi:hypothetical protein